MPTLPQCKRSRSRNSGGGGGGGGGGGSSSGHRHSRVRLSSRNNLQESLAEDTGTEMESQPNRDALADDEFKFLLTISDLVPLNVHHGQRELAASSEATGPAGERKKPPLAAKSSCGRAAESDEDEDESTGAIPAGGANTADSANNPNGFIVRLTGILPYLDDR